MTSKAEWIALAERCEKAMGDDREIDCLIAVAVNDVPAGYKRHDAFSWVCPQPPFMPLAYSPAYFTHSLDAITSLIERELPKAEFNSTSKVQGDGMGGLKRYAYAWLVIGPDVWGDTAVASEALARCAAFCRAMAEVAE